MPRGFPGYRTCTKCGELKPCTAYTLAKRLNGILQHPSCDECKQRFKDYRAAERARKADERKVKSEFYWSQEEDDILAKAHAGGLTIKQAIPLLPRHRAYKSIVSRRMKLGLRKDVRKPLVGRLERIAQLKAQGASNRSIARHLNTTASAVVGVIYRNREAFNAFVTAQRAASHRTPNGAGRAVEPRPVEPGMRGGAADHAERGTARAG